MKKIVTFQDFEDENANEVYQNVAEQANEWLAEHPNAAIIASHTNLQATGTWTEYVITLIVDLPE